MKSGKQAISTMRRSRQREEILKVLKETTSHPTADWIYRQVRNSVPNISLGTVYRNLHILRVAGEILELNYGNSLSRFDFRTDEHYHFLCDKCGCVRDVEKCEGLDLNSAFARAASLDIREHRLEFHGLCLDCKV